MQNVNIQNSATRVIAAGNRNPASLFIENQSDTAMRLAIGDENVPLLSATLGKLLDPGDTIIIEGQSASSAVYAIHAGTGSKVAHWQLV